MQANYFNVIEDTTCSEIFQMYQFDDHLSEEGFLLASIAACGEEHTFADFGIKDHFIRFTKWKQIYQEITRNIITAQMQLIPENTNLEDFRRLLQSACIYLQEDELVGVFQLLDSDRDGNVSGADALPYIN